VITHQQARALVALYASAIRVGRGYCRHRKQ